mgnify:CR=1 FL=1
MSLPTMKTPANQKDIDFKERLRKRGDSLRAWSLRNGFAPRTVYVTIKRWGNRTDRQPHGGFGRQIMALLRKEVAG